MKQTISQKGLAKKNKKGKDDVRLVVGSCCDGNVMVTSIRNLAGHSYYLMDRVMRLRLACRSSPIV